ncbi:MAG: hypothetical protein HZA92_01615 [Verrucomicrobia bacterium]|nr:hypothetical protein [Verrucomicrobiota bacterium]
MKLLIHQPRSARAGSVLVVTLLIAMVIGITLAAFMDLSSAQHRSVVRSGVWNSCIPMAESGLEEALTHVFLNSSNLASQGWTMTTTGLAMSNGVSLTGTLYYKSRVLNGGNFIAAIQSGSTPTITVQGNLPKPLSSADMISRTIEVRTVGGALFARGLVARGTIDWNGNILADSFDSQNPAYSTGGLYDASKRKDNGSIGSVEGNVDVGANGTIYGTAGTGPTGTITTGPHGAVGDASYIAGGGTGVQTGHSQNDLNVSFPDATVPFTTGYTIPSGGNVTNITIITNTSAATSLSYPSTYVGTVSSNRPTSSTYPSGTTYPVSTNVTATVGKGKGATTTYTTNFTYTQFAYNTNSYTTNSSVAYYDAILDNGDYYLSGINNENVLIRGNARLHVAGSVSESGGKAIAVANSGTLQMWVGGSISLSGQAAINATGDAQRMMVYGLPTCTSASFGGNAAWTGTLYAPQAALTFNGGGMDTVDFIGAAIVGSAQLNGHFSFHYDENLGRNGPSASFIIDSWVEL